VHNNITVQVYYHHLQYILSYANTHYRLNPLKQHILLFFHLKKTAVNMSLIEIPNNIDPKSIQKLQHLVSKVRAHLQNQNRRHASHVELEIRLGNENKSFVSNIGQSAFMRILGAAEASQVWNNVVKDYEIVDFFYKLDDGRNVRTSRYLNENGEIQIEHIEKQRQEICMLEIHGVPTIAHTIRVAFNTETTVSGEILPDITSTERVRIKHRRSYIWGNWQFDMTTVWTAPTYAVAMKYRDDTSTNHATYEVEIEVIDPVAYYESKFHTDEYISVSLLMKVLGLLPRHINIK